jgi:tetratricopeptide (TPR) repeat protein
MIRARRLILGVAVLAAAATAAGGRARAEDAAWPDLSQPGPAGGGENDAAVVVGVEKYAFVPAVPGAQRNADDWYAWLTKGRGTPVASVRLLRDSEATVEGMRRAALEASADVKPGGTLWFVFVGHGAPAKDGHGGVLVGYDVQQNADSLFARSLPQAELASTLSAGSQARTVLVVDACFSGRSAGGASLAPGLQPLIIERKADLPANTLLFSAGKADQFAGPLPRAARPAFSYLMLGALRGWADANRDGKVTADEAVAYSRDTLRALVTDRSQTPELQGAGDVVLVSKVSDAGPALASLAVTRAGDAGGEGSAREHVLRGQLYAQKQRYPEAEREFLRAEELAPSWPSLQEMLAEAAEKQQKYDVAIARERKRLASASESERADIEKKIAELSVAADETNVAKAELAKSEAQKRAAVPGAWLRERASRAGIENEDALTSIIDEYDARKVWLESKDQTYVFTTSAGEITENSFIRRYRNEVGPTQLDAKETSRTSVPLIVVSGAVAVASLALVVTNAAIFASESTSAQNGDKEHLLLMAIPAPLVIAGSTISLILGTGMDGRPDDHDVSRIDAAQFVDTYNEALARDLIRSAGGRESNLGKLVMRDRGSSAGSALDAPIPAPRSSRPSFTVKPTLSVGYLGFGGTF